ncbi:MAG: helix-turn-helix domain-containing protein [Bacteroidia bacterium]
MADIEKDKVLKMVGNRIKKIRIQQNLSRYQLAFETKTSEKHIRQIENAEINTSIFKIFQIAEALGVKPEEIISNGKYYTIPYKEPSKKTQSKKESSGKQ